MKLKKSLFLSLTLLVIIATTALVYSNNKISKFKSNSQNPNYIIEARKNIIGVWYDEDFPTSIRDFKEDGKLICLSDDEPAKLLTYEIINSTPICGQDVEIDESKETMYLVTKDENGLVHCDKLYFKGNQNQRMHLWSLGGRLSPDAISVFIKKSKTRVEKF